LSELEDVCNEKEFERQFKTVAPLLRNFLIFKFKDEFSAEDMVQEAFSVLWQNCKKVIPSHAKAYVFRIAQNQFMSKFKKQKTAQNHIEFVVNKSESEDPAFIMEYNEFESTIQASINKLPDGQREVFLLNRIEKKTYKEIADLLELSVKAVEKRMHKALIELRKISKNI
jgi:RNA polymerase sigma-70 factor (family 1)